MWAAIFSDGGVDEKMSLKVIECYCRLMIWRSYGRMLRKGYN